MTRVISPAGLREYSHIPRKLFHFFLASIIPTLYLFEVLERELIMAGVVIATVVWVVFDFARIYVEPINNLFSRLFRFLMKEKESDRLTGVSYVLIGSTIALLFYPPMVAVASLYFMSVGDPFASIIGKATGRFEIIGGKTLEGSAAMFTICMVMGLWVGLHPGGAMLGAFSATFAELSSGFLDDNLTVPVISGAVMMIAGAGL